MLNGRRHHMFFARIHVQCGMKGRVVGLGSAAGEDDLLRLSLNQRGDFFTGAFDVTMNLGAKGVGAGGVAPELTQKRHHRIHNLRGDSSGGVVVEVVDRLELTHDVAIG